MKKYTRKDLPRWMVWVLKIMGPAADSDSLIHDLEIEYNESLIQEGRFRAVFRVFMVGIAACPELIFMAFRGRSMMLMSYVKPAFRRMQRESVYTVINIMAWRWELQSHCSFWFLYDMR